MRKRRKKKFLAVLLEMSVSTLKHPKRWARNNIYAAAVVQ
jgi:hypothetical protein